MTHKFILIALFATMLISCNKKSGDDFLVTLDNTLWRHSPATSIPLNGASILFVDDYLIPTIDDAVTCLFYSDGTCDIHVMTATRGQTAHTTKWTCSSEGDVIIKKGSGIWMSGLFLGQKLTLCDGLIFNYYGKTKK